MVVSTGRWLMKRTRSQVPWRTRNSVPGADGPKAQASVLKPGTSSTSSGAAISS
jgi:hypothetical protein